MSRYRSHYSGLPVKYWNKNKKIVKKKQNLFNKIKIKFFFVLSSNMHRNIEFLNSYTSQRLAPNVSRVYLASRCVGKICKLKLQIPDAFEMPLFANDSEEFKCYWLMHTQILYAVRYRSVEFLWNTNLVKPRTPNNKREWSKHIEIYGDAVNKAIHAYSKKVK